MLELCHARLSLLGTGVDLAVQSWPIKMFILFCLCRRESLMKISEPAMLSHFKPTDYVNILAQIHEELESCPPDDKTSLYLQ
jgi:hypothetical protein